MRRWEILIGGVLLLVMVGASPSRAQGPTPTPAIGGEGYSYIAFVSNRDQNSEIYVMNPDGSGQFNLTNHPANDSNPAWSPDGADRFRVNAE